MEANKNNAITDTNSLNDSSMKTSTRLTKQVEAFVQFVESVKAKQEDEAIGRDKLINEM